MRHLELLAPARNADIGIAAIDCGADAVYIAGPEFGARRDAGNQMDEVRRLCEYAHRFGVRIFLTLNTILYDTELQAADRLLHEAAEAGVDAVIAQDLAVFEALRQAQGPAIHASTQCAIRTPEQARFYESLGASRLVLERQLSLEQVRAIREAVSCELEFFVHGALCVCYSGQCYMSEAVAGRSANRGACIQACRSLYDLVDDSGKTLVKDKALLSLKDYNLLGRLSDLAEAGIDSFKIEGRLKNVSYVRNVVRAYSLALDELVARYPDKYARSSYGRSEGGFTPDSGKTFNRGYTELFLDGRRGKWSSMDAPKSIGEEIGTVVRISNGRPTGPGETPLHRTETTEILINLDNPTLQLRNGDGFSFISKSRNEIIGFRGDVCRGCRIVTRNVPELFVGARLHRNLSIAFEKEMEANLPVRRIPVDVAITVTPELKVRAISQDGREVSFEQEAGNIKAENRERMEAMFSSQIGKASGIYSFSLASIDVRTPDDSLPFLSAAALNGIRREIADRLDRMPCGKVLMYNPHDTVASTGSATGLQGPKIISYKSNVSNGIAERAYRRLGASSIEKAYELTHKKEAELMRSKYCIRHELGLCRKGHQTDDLYLVNNGRRYRLGFDCTACEMTVKAENQF